MPQRTLVPWLIAFVVAGCDCPGQQVSANQGELGVVWTSGGEQLITRDATFDFGEVLVSERITLPVQARNLGINTLTLVSLELKEGSEVGVPDATATSTFDLDFRRVEVPASGGFDFTASFTPRSAGAFEARLELESIGTRPEDGTASLTLRGRGVRGACDLPAVIDFGKVPVGDTLTLPVVLRNTLQRDATAFVGPFTGADAASFGVGSSTGELPVGPRGEVEVLFTFSPRERRPYGAQVPLRRTGGCPTTLVTIQGEGADEILQWAPVALRFGTVPPGKERTQQFTVTNLSFAPVTLTELASPSTDFRRVVPSGVDATRLVVPGGGGPVTVTIGCRPSDLGRRDSVFTFKTPLRRQPMGSITLACTGGGPRLRATPSPTVSFGRVAYFPGNGGPGSRRRITVQNIGTVANPPDPTANLFLGSVAPDGTPGQLPFFEVRPLNVATEAGEFEVAIASGYDGANGLEATVGRNSLELVVTFRPASPGRKEAELLIFSNDPAQPTTRLVLTAEAQVLPPCSLQVRPGALNFGLVTPPTSKDLPVTFTNLGVGPGDLCLLSALDVEPGSSAAYSVVGGPVAEKELRAGESWTVMVRVAPPGPVPVALTPALGHLSVEVSSPQNPLTRIPLTTLVGTPCLAITPDPVDFGTVKLGCNSPARTLTIYNVCPVPVTLTGVSLAVPGGPLPGSALCPGMGPCPEFAITSAPTIPMGGLTIGPGSAPVQLQLRFSPLDVGAETGALSLSVIQRGQTVNTLVELRGEGDTTGRQTDTFQQLQQPKADILLVIDDSCSMEDKQTSLANNFASFIQYANTTNTDFQLGVITTSQDPQPCVPLVACIGVPGEGKLVSRGTVGPILRPSTPNLAQAFATLVAVGTNGDVDESGLSTATMALTPPRIAGENAGFLRADANLAVVVISDAGDQSPQPVSHYQNRLINVKGFNRLSMFSFSSIVPLQPVAPAPCSYDSGDPQRYVDVSRATAGVTDDICSSNWAATLQSLGRTAFGFRTTFYLTSVPDLSMGRTLEVRVNGAVVPPADYTWDAATNAIVFTSSSAPQPGRQLTVSYDTTCF